MVRNGGKLREGGAAASKARSSKLSAYRSFLSMIRPG
jgi:hypothetical protein